MKLRLADDSRVSVTVRSKGVFGALEHTPTFSAKPQGVALLEVDPEAPIDVPVEGSIRGEALEAPADASAFDKKQMLENIRGKQVLEVARWPSLSFRGRYTGTLEKGRLDGQLEVRGTPREVAWDVTTTKDGSRLRARGRWQGTMSDLGIKPFKALLGALRLHDEVRIDLDVAFDCLDV